MNAKDFFMDFSETPIANFHKAVESVYDWIVETIKDNGGTLDMSATDLDTAYAMEADGDGWAEYQVTALRVSDENMLEYKSTGHPNDWWDLKYSDNYFLPTLSQIADNFEGYLGE